MLPTSPHPAPTNFEEFLKEAQKFRRSNEWYLERYNKMFVNPIRGDAILLAASLLYAASHVGPEGVILLPEAFNETCFDIRDLKTVRDVLRSESTEHGLTDRAYFGAILDLFLCPFMEPDKVMAVDMPNSHINYRKGRIADAGILMRATLIHNYICGPLPETARLPIREVFERMETISQEGGDAHRALFFLDCQAVLLCEQNGVELSNFPGGKPNRLGYDFNPEWTETVRELLHKTDLKSANEQMGRKTAARIFVEVVRRFDYDYDQFIKLMPLTMSRVHNRQMFMQLVKYHLREVANTQQAAADNLGWIIALAECDSLSTACNICVKHMPEADQKAFYPRRYAPAADYHSPKIMLVVGAMRTILNGGAVLATKEKDLYTIRSMDVIAQNDVPTYFISKSLLEDLKDSDLPNDVSLKDIEWPLPAMLWMIPTKTLYTSDDREIAAIWVSHDEVENRAAIGAICTDTHTPGGSFAIDSRSLHSIVHDLTPDEVPIVLPHKPNITDKFSCGWMNLPDKKVSQAALQVLMAMASVPEWREPETVHTLGRTKGVAPNERKLSPDLWHPNIFGRQYQSHATGEGDGGTHASPVIHKRRGHWRTRWGISSNPVTLDHLDKRVIWLDDQRRACRLDFLSLETDPPYAKITLMADGTIQHLNPSELKAATRHSIFIKWKMIGLKSHEKGES